MNWKFWQKESNISEPVITLNKELQIVDNWIPVSHRGTCGLKHTSKDLYICIYGESWMNAEENQLISLTENATYSKIWYDIQNKSHQEQRNNVARKLGL